MNTPRVYTCLSENPPCFQCVERKLGCHSNCFRYLTYIEKRKEIKRDLYEKQRGERIAEDYNSKKRTAMREFYRKAKRR